MAFHFGKTAYCTMGLQSNQGTAAATMTMGIPVTDAPSIAANVTRQQLQEFRKSSAEATDFLVTSIGSSGGLNAPAYPGGPLENMIYGVMGTKSTITTLLHYVHTFTAATTLPYYTIYKGLDTLNVESFKDCQIGTLAFNMAADSQVTVDATIMGTPTGIGTAQVTPTYTTDRAFSWTDVSVKVDTVANCDVTAMDLTIDRGLKSVRTACASATPLVDNMVYPTTTKVSGSIEMFFEDYTDYAYWLGASGATTYSPNASVATTKRALEITLTGASIDTGPTVYNTVVITIPKAVYNAADISTPFDDRMKIKFGFDAYWDTTQTAGKEVLNIVCTSLLPSITGS